MLFSNSFGILEKFIQQKFKRRTINLEHFPDTKVHDQDNNPWCAKQAWCFLPGVSPRRARLSQPLVPRVAVAV
jgi:hypothetical protein